MEKVCDIPCFDIRIVCMKWLSSCLLVLFFMWPSKLQAEFRNWTNTDDQILNAELVKIETDTVLFRLRNGGMVTYSKSKLSQADRTYLIDHPVVSPTAKLETAAKPPTQAATPTLDPKRKAKWLTRMSKAQDEAKETGLPILVLFTGTSWCPYCIKLEAEVFSKKEFSAYANQSLVLLKFDFGSGGTASRDQKEIQADFGVKGFPTYFLIDAKGTHLGRGGYHDGINPETFITWAKNAAAKSK